MYSGSEEVQEPFLQVVQLGWLGFQEIGRGALFLGIGDDYPLYVKQEYAPQMKMLDSEQKKLMAKLLQEYDPEKQVVVFDQGKLSVFDVFRGLARPALSLLKAWNVLSGPNNLPPSAEDNLTNNFSNKAVFADWNGLCLKIIL